MCKNKHLLSISVSFEYWYVRMKKLMEAFCVPCWIPLFCVFDF